MKKTLFLLLCACTLMMTSCNKQSQGVLVEVIATVKNGPAESQCFLQIDDNTALLPTNLSQNPFGTEQRVYAYYNDKGSMEAPSGSTLNWRTGEIVSPLYPILTKNPVEKAVSTAGVEIYRSWANSIEDGYMTLHFEGLWSSAGIVHEINLEKHFVADSTCFILKHDCKGDKGWYRSGGLVAFRVGEDIQASGKTGEFDVYVRYEGYSRSKRIKFHHYTDGTYSAPVSDTDYVLEESENSLIGSNLSNCE